MGNLLKELESQLGAISISEALKILHDFGCETEEVLVTGPRGSYKTTPWKIAADYSDEYPAQGTREFTFCGGPPGQHGWFTGTLLTLVIDKILYRIAKEKITQFYYQRNGIKVKVKG